MITNKHPTEAQLVLAMDQELDQQESEAISAHLENCAVCHGKWEQLRGVSGRIVACHQALQLGRLSVPRAADTKSRRLWGIAAVAAAAACIAVFLSPKDRPTSPAHRAEVPQAAASSPLKPPTHVSLTQPVRQARRKPAQVLAAGMSNIVE